MKKVSTVISRLQESIQIFLKSFQSLALPYFLLTAPISLSMLIWQKEYVTFVQDHLFLALLSLIAILTLYIFLTLVYQKGIIENYCKKTKKISYWSSVSSIFSQFKGISYVYWRMLLRILPTIALSIVIAFSFIILSLMLFPGNQGILIIGTLLIIYIPIIKRMVHLSFLATHALYADDYSKQGTLDSEASTEGYFWSVFGNLILAYSWPILWSMLVAYLPQFGITIPLPIFIPVWILNYPIGYIGLIYCTLYYRDILLPREQILKTETPSL